MKIADVNWEFLKQFIYEHYKFHYSHDHINKPFYTKISIPAQNYTIANQTDYSKTIMNQTNLQNK